MANHYRKTIRDKVVSLLAGITYNSQAITIWRTRAVPFFQVELPAIAVYMINEDADEMGTAPRFYRRTLTLSVQIVGEENVSSTPNVSNIDDMFDHIARQVEQKLFIDPFLGNTVNDCILSGTQIRYQEDGDRLIGSCILNWDITYETDAPDADTVGDLDDFETEKTGIDIDADGNADISSESTVEAP